MEKSIIVYLTEENAKFYEKDGFLALKAFLPPKAEYDLEETEEKDPLWQDIGRVFLHRAFPFNNPERYISVFDEEKYEYGIINSLDDFSEESKALLKKALERKYFMPRITKILSIKEQFGFSFWKVVTDKGEAEFSVKDTFKSIVKMSDKLIVVIDSDDGRYMIENPSELDSQSFKKIDIYL